MVSLDKSNRVFGLDLLRAIAILWVIILHGGALVKEYYPQYPDVGVLFDGVDLFFVLSGFLIGSIFIKQITGPNYSFQTNLLFWKRRWFRTLPNYFLVLILICVLDLFFQTEKGSFDISYLFFLQNFHQPVPDFFSVTWSLSVEEWFYLMFPVAYYFVDYYFPSRTPLHNLFVTICLFILLPTVYRFYKAGYFVSKEHPFYVWLYLFRNTVVTRVDSIVYGVIGGLVKHKFPELWKRYSILMFIFGLVLLYIGANFFKHGYFRYVFFFNIMPLGLMFILPLFDGWKRVHRLIAIPITFISIISYSLYLVHYSIVILPLTQFFFY